MSTTGHEDGARLKLTCCSYLLIVKMAVTDYIITGDKVSLKDVMADVS